MGRDVARPLATSPPPRRSPAALLLLAAVVAATLVGGAGPALACSCVPSPPPETAMSEADAVFVGEVTELREVASGTRVATLAVTEVFVGDLAAEVEVRTPADSAACGHAFQRGRADLVYAVLDADGVLNTNLCDRTAPLSEAEEDLSAFGEGTEPARDGVAADDPADPDDPVVPDEPEVLVTEVEGGADDGAGTGFRLAAVALAIAAVIAITVGVQRRRRT